MKDQLSNTRPLTLCAAFTHPIQYLVPICRCLATRPEIGFTALYASLGSVRGEFDPGFNAMVAWNTDLLAGYNHVIAENRGGGISAKGFFAFNGRGLKGLLRASKPDFVLVPGYNYWFYLQVIQAAHRLGIRVLLRGDNKDVRERRPFHMQLARSLFLRLLYARVDGFLAVGRYMRRHFMRYGVDPQKVWDSPHTVDAAPYDQLLTNGAEVRRDRRAELGIPEDAVVVLFAGRMIPEKNVDLLAQSFEEASRESGVQCSLLIVGDGPLRKEFESRFRSLLGSKLRMTGFVNQKELPSYYVASDLFVLPSRESWGLAVNEAMSAGLPVIVSDRCGCHEDLVPDNTTGRVCRYGDRSMLTETLNHFLTNPDVRAACGRKARLHVRSFSIDKAADGIVTAMTSLRKESQTPNRAASTAGRPGSRQTP